MPSAVSSAGGLLTLLEEDNDDIKQYALSKLDGVVNDFFFEISPSIASIEALYEDESFKDRELAALVASKVRFFFARCFAALLVRRAFARRICIALRRLCVCYEIGGCSPLVDVKSSIQVLPGCLKPVQCGAAAVIMGPTAPNLHRRCCVI